MSQDCGESKQLTWSFFSRGYDPDADVFDLRATTGDGRLTHDIHRNGKQKEPLADRYRRTNFDENAEEEPQNLGQTHRSRGRSDSSLAPPCGLAKSIASVAGQIHRFEQRFRLGQKCHSRRTRVLKTKSWLR